MRVAIYLRVSTDEQTTDNQRRELEEVVAHRGWTLVNVYEDKGISGSKGRDERPAFDAMLKDAVRGKIDMVAAWSVDRLGRSLQDLLEFLAELKAVKVNLYLHQQGVDTSTPAGVAMFQMLGIFAQFERGMIVERVRAGVARAQAQGKHCGRPRTTEAIRVRVVNDIRSGQRPEAVADRYAVSIATVYRIVAEAETAEPAAA